MKFGIFYEHQLPRPWKEGDELKLYQEALDQVELADRLGIDYAWEVEHHFLEEYSHSSAPEVFLAACSQRTKNIRLGHGIRQVIPGYNHPARTAECIATLDLVHLRIAAGQATEVAVELEAMVSGSDPRLPRDVALYELGQLYLSEQDPVQATDYFQKLVDEFPESPYNQLARQQLMEIG